MNPVNDQIPLTEVGGFHSFSLFNDHAKKFHVKGIKHTFGKLDQQSMLLKALKYLSSALMMEGNIILSVDS